MSLIDEELIKILSITDNATIREMLKSGKMARFINTYKQDICRYKLGEKWKLIYENTGLYPCTAYRINRIGIKRFLNDIDDTHIELENVVKYALLNKVKIRRALTIAIVSGKVNTVKTLLKNGGKDVVSNDMVWDAINNYNIEIITLLLQYTTPSHDNLIFAITEGHLEIVRLFLEHDTEVRAESLVTASRYRYLEIVKLLLEHGVRGRALLTVRNLELVKFPSSARHAHLELVSLPPRDASLLVASKQGYLDIVKLLLEHGADIHAYNDWSLIVASTYGRLEIVKFLLEHGADLHAQNDLGLKRASEHGHMQIVKLLLEHGAHVHAKFITRTVSKGHFNIAKLLTKHLLNIT